VPNSLACDDRHAQELHQAAIPVLDRNLERVPRPWDGTLPDAIENPARLRDLPELKNRACRHGNVAGCPSCPAGGDAEGEPYYAAAVPGEVLVAPPTPFIEDPPQPPALQVPPPMPGRLETIR
jgi:hypothetical protein